MFFSHENNYNHIKLHVAIALSAVAAMASLANFFFGGVSESQIFNALVKMESLKAGGSENRSKMQQLFTSDTFKNQQAQVIDQALQRMGGEQAPTQQAQANQNPTQDKKPMQLSKDQIKSIKTNAYIEGNKDAKFLIVEYTDPECPFCIRHFKDNTIKTAMDSNKGNIAHITKVVQGVNHPGTEFKSLAILCAGKIKGEKGYYQLFNDIMTASITAVPNNDQTIALAEKMDIKKAELESCMTDASIKSLYSANWAEAQGFGQSGTPGNLIINTENGNYIALAGAYPASEFIQTLSKL